MASNVKKRILLIVLIYLLVVAVVVLNEYPAGVIGVPDLEKLVMPPAADAAADVSDADETDRLDIMFSHTGHFYDEDIEISIFASIPEAVIHYTTDGTEPAAGSPVYTEPILFPKTEGGTDIGVYPLKAIAILGEEMTRPLVHTYFVAEGIHERFDTIVFSISTNDEYLYDYDTGIFVEGRTRDEYRAENPRARIEPPAPANFNWRGMEAERPVYVEMFEPDGQRIVAQGAGLRVYGGWSRASDYKSLRIIPRRMYEPGEGNFEFDFFPDDVRADRFGTPIAEYDQLFLSNQANDRNFSMLRREVNYNLARSAGLRVVSPSRAAAVFINGEYYGFSWLQVRINEQYLEDVYSSPQRSFQIVGNGELWIETDDAAAREAIEYLNSFYYKDFTDDNVLAEFEQLVDIEHLLLYYAYQTYAGNRDWPNNNLKRWRYTGAQEDEDGNPPGLAPELDGRWRYVTYDLDFLMSLYENDVRAGSPSFSNYMTRGNERYSVMLDALFARPELADKYAMYVCDIASNVLTSENVSAQIDLFYSEMRNELGYALKYGTYDHWVSFHSVEDNHANMIQYTKERYEHFLGGMREYFGWNDEMFTVEVSGAGAVIGSQSAASSTYFAHLKIPVRPNPGRYEVFDHWVLNGKVIDTPEITVSAADAVNGVVKIELYVNEIKPDLMIKEAYGSSVRNGAVLHNTSDETLDTAGLYLTDDLSNPYRFSIPQASVAPGGSLEFAGRGSRDNEDIHKIQMSFNVREGEMLYLCNENGEVLDWMPVKSGV